MLLLGEGDVDRGFRGKKASKGNIDEMIDIEGGEVGSDGNR